MDQSPASDRSGRPRRGIPRGLILAGVLSASVALSLIATFTWTPAIPAVTFISIKGEKISAADLRGRVTLINFWATDCPVCIKEMPEMVRTYDRYRERGLEFIAVAMRHDPPNRVIHYAESNRLPFRIALDPMGELASAFGSVTFTPTTFVIDRRGRIVLKIAGEPDFAKLRRLLEEKLAEPA